MKKKLLVAALSVSAFSAVHAADGTINFTGKVTADTCTVNNPTSGTSLNVILPPVSTKSLAGAGTVAGRTPFAITLSACKGTEVNASFAIGTDVDSVTGRLKNTAATAAPNVQIQLVNKDGGQIDLLTVGSDGTQSGTQWVAMTGETAVLNYGAEYYATGEAGSGDVNAKIEYTLAYK